MHANNMVYGGLDAGRFTMANYREREKKQTHLKRSV